VKPAIYSSVLCMVGFMYDLGDDGHLEGASSASASGGAFNHDYNMFPLATMFLLSGIS